MANAVNYTLATRTLLFTITAHKLEQNSSYVFTITNALTPSSMVEASSGVASTLDSHDRDIDMTDLMSTFATAIGALSSATFATEPDNADYPSRATVTFQTHGRVEVGGFLTLVMPDEKVQVQKKIGVLLTRRIRILGPPGRLTHQAFF